MIRFRRNPLARHAPRRWRRLVPVASSALLFAALPAVAQPGLSFAQERALDPSAPAIVEPVDETAPFGRVLYQEGSVQARRGSAAPLPLEVNYPLFAGDVIETDGGQRIEIQLPDGSRVRIDRLSSVTVDDFAAGRGGTSVLAVSDGHVQVVLRDAHGGEGFRIDTPAASVYPLDASSFRVDVERDDVVRVSVESGRVEVAGDGGSVVLVSGERTSVVPSAAPRDPWRYAAGSRDGFDAWCLDRGETLQIWAERGEEYEALPEGVQPYYEELSEAGDWIYAEDYGWGFRPEVSPDWQPFADGVWHEAPSGSPVWVGAEPWGWATWRFGSWNFDVGLGGWFWVPGSTWTAANVWWFYGPTFVGWVPTGFWGWPAHHCCGLWRWGSPWFNGCPWTFVVYGDFFNNPVPRAAVSRGRILDPDLDRGVVSREAIPGRGAHRDRGADASGRRDRTALEREVYDRARQRAERGDAAVRPVPQRSVDEEMREAREVGRRSGLPADRRDVAGRRVGSPGGASRDARTTPEGARPGDDDAAANAQRQATPRSGRGIDGGTGRPSDPADGAPAVEPRSPASGSATPRGGTGAVAPRSGATRPPASSPRPVAPRAPRRGAVDPSTSADPAGSPDGSRPATAPAPRAFPRDPGRQAAPRSGSDESVRRFFERLSEQNRAPSGTRVTPRPRATPLQPGASPSRPARPGSGSGRPQSAAPAPRAPRPQTASPGKPTGGGQAPRAPSAGSRGGTSKAPQSTPAPRGGGSSSSSSGGGSRGASPRR